jgi:transcriptional regulator with XRE-family HTH domain
MLTEQEYAEHVVTLDRRPPHPLCLMIRSLRHAAGMSLSTFEIRTGIPAVVVGAYERGDRTPPLSKLEAIFDAFGYRLVALPTGSASVRLSGDMISDLRAIADQLETLNGVSELPEPTPPDD